jgi:hypothetical protein
METSRFDTLVRSLTRAGTRRRLVCLLTALPLTGGLSALVDGLEEAVAAHPVERIQKRRDHHRKRARRRQDRRHEKRTRDNGSGGNNKKNNGGGNLRASDCLPPLDTNNQPTDLQQAINTASPFANLVLCAGDFEAAGLSFTRNVTLIGAGSSPGTNNFTSLNGSNAAGVLGVFSGNVFISNLVVSGANGNVPAIGLAGGSLTLANVAVLGNKAGGIVNEGGTLHLTQGTQVQGNGSNAQGGGILHHGGTTTVDSGCSIEGNTAADGGGIFDDTPANANDVQLGDTLIVSGNHPNNCAPAGAVQNCLET